MRPGVGMAGADGDIGPYGTGKMAGRDDFS